MSEMAQTDGVIRRGIDQGLHPGAQVCVWHDGECAVDAGWGEAAPGRTMTADTRTLWMSAGKPITAVALAQRVEAGEVDWDDPVAEYVPEFAAQGKEAVTLRHVLTHTGGFRSAALRYPEQSWDEAIAAVCDARLETGWRVGETAGYHAHAGWNIVGKVLEVCSGQALGEHLREAVLRPWGMDRTWIGVPAEPSGVYDAVEPTLAEVVDSSRSPEQPATPTGYHERAWVTGQRPGGNVYGPASDLARFYRGLLNGGELDGKRLLSPEAVADLTARHRRDTEDRTFRAVMDWGLGFMVNNRRHDAANAELRGISSQTDPATPYGFGPAAGDSAYGHCGNQTSAGFADPEHGLVVVMVFNGMPGEKRHQRRMHETLGAVYDDLGLG
ncbi:MAG: serine hydrolase domain-containing protein [Planctomycetota bacterium]